MDSLEPVAFKVDASPEGKLAMALLHKKKMDDALFQISIRDKLLTAMVLRCLK